MVIDEVVYARREGRVLCVGRCSEPLPACCPRSSICFCGCALNGRYFEFTHYTMLGLTLSSIGMPSSVLVVCVWTFRVCEALSHLTCEASSGLLRIERYAFASCPSLASVCISSSVEVLCEGCFCGCTRLSSFTFERGSRLWRLEKSAFSNCSSLSSICIPSSVEMLGEECFNSCKSLRSLTFETGSKLSYIEKFAFAYCSSLSSIWLPPGLLVIVRGALNHTSLEEISVGEDSSTFKIKGHFLVNFGCTSGLGQLTWI
jgi:hypothetical protein